MMENFGLSIKEIDMTDNVVTMGGKPVDRMGVKEDILDSVARSIDDFGIEDIGVLYVLLGKGGRYKCCYNALNTKLEPYEVRAVGSTTLSAYAASFIEF